MVSGLDPLATTWAVMVLPAAIIALAFGLHELPNVLAVTSALFVMGSFRLEAEVTARGATIKHKLLYFIPWRWRHVPGRAFVTSDGWGDWADPTTVELCVGEGKPLELAWVLRNDGPERDAFVRDFEEAVGRIA